MKTIKKAILLFAVLTFFASCISTSALAKGNKDDSLKLTAAGVFAAGDDEYIEIHSPADGSSYRQGDSIYVNIRIYDTWEYYYTKGFVAIKNLSEDKFYYSEKLDVVEVDGYDDFTGNISTSDFPAGRYRFYVMNFAYETPYSSDYTDLGNEPCVYVDLTISPASAGSPAPSAGSVTVSQSPSSVKAKVKKNKVVLSWRNIIKEGWVKSIQIQYASNPSFTKGKGMKTVGKSKTSATLKLKSHKTYYIRLRYKGIDGFSKWSAVKKVRTN